MKKKLFITLVSLGRCALQATGHDCCTSRRS
jgi:hypothetical protein